MKRILGILMMVIAMMTVTTSVCAQAPNQKQRLSREQLAEKQAQYISRNLGLDEKTNAKFIETYTDCQKDYEYELLLLSVSQSTTFYYITLLTN